MNGKEIFVRSWNNLGLGQDGEKVYEDLEVNYGESSRKYHAISHIEKGYRDLELILYISNQQNELVISWPFHDVVYYPRVPDSVNVQNSVILAKATIEDAG